MGSVDLRLMQITAADALDREADYFQQMTCPERGYTFWTGIDRDAVISRNRRVADELRRDARSHVDPRLQLDRVHE
jgi:hypothetical protein